VLRRSEWVLIAYFSYAAAVSLILPVRPGVALVTVSLNAALAGGLLLLAYAESLRHKHLLAVLRNIFPLPLMLLAYREMGWFAPATRTYTLERAWVVYDRLLLDKWGVRAAIEALGPILPSVLEVSYSLVYTIAPLCVVVFFIVRKPDRIETFHFTFLLAILMAYVLFPYFPSEPPRTVFPDQDLPTVTTIFRRFNYGVLGKYGIHTSVFPSAHVSGSMAAALAMRRLLPDRPWVWRGLLALAILIATATVYGRYHFSVDAAAGLTLAVLAGRIGAALSPSWRA
jgi:membrane-associated phospholipid phosphatase